MRLELLFIGIMLIPQFAKADRIALAVLDLNDRGVGIHTCSTLTDVVTMALTELDVFNVLSRNDIQRMLTFEGDKQLLGCDADASCLTEIGGALGVALLITGSVGKVGETYILNLSLTDTEKVKVLAREQRKVSSSNQLTEQTELATRYLVRELLELEQGDLLFRVSENGADVEIDGRLEGVTPIARMRLAGGPHRIQVIKKGFVTWSKDISIRKDQPVFVEATLIPSLEFIANYEENASTWRLFAYVIGGTGVVAATTSALTYFVWNAKQARNFNDEVSAAGCHAKQDALPTVACKQTFSDRKADIKRMDIIAIATGWTGIAAIGVGLYLFWLGPNPDKYEVYRGANTAQVSINVRPVAYHGWATTATITY